MDKCNYFKGISQLERCEILALINSIAMIMSEGLDESDLSMMGTLFNAIGDTISAFAAMQRKE
ncbi:MAG: hypothetical protein FWE14_08375 [Lachnospiraceae bacterium]|nr:hypothetical protein [Lachnospiraceae bacterium]